jgi:hypothetical protein
MADLTKDDLVLLMESYRNMISMHQAILDQSTKSIEISNAIIIKLDALTTKQSSLCNELSNISKSLEDFLRKAEARSTALVAQINGHEKKSLEDHGKIINKIYIGWVGMATIVLSLIGLIINLTHK